MPPNTGSHLTTETENKIASISMMQEYRKLEIKDLLEDVCKRYNNLPQHLKQKCSRYRYARDKYREGAFRSFFSKFTEEEIDQLFDNKIDFKNLKKRKPKKAAGSAAKPPRYPKNLKSTAPRGSGPGHTIAKPRRGPGSGSKQGQGQGQGQRQRPVLIAPRPTSPSKSISQLRHIASRITEADEHTLRQRHPNFSIEDLCAKAVKNHPKEANISLRDFIISNISREGGEAIINIIKKLANEDINALAKVAATPNKSIAITHRR